MISYYLTLYAFWYANLHVTHIILRFTFHTSLLAPLGESPKRNPVFLPRTVRRDPRGSSIGVMATASLAPLLAARLGWAMVYYTSGLLTLGIFLACAAGNGGRRVFRVLRKCSVRSCYLARFCTQERSCWSRESGFNLTSLVSSFSNPLIQYLGRTTRNVQFRRV